MRDDFLIRLRRRLRSAQHGPTDAGSAMIMALMLMLVFAVAGVTLATVIGVNARLSLQTSSRGTSVYIAEAGLETTLGMFRAATGSTSGVGDLKRLPCQVTGSADGSTDPDQQYVVTIRYGLEDPSAHATDAAWLDATNTAGVSAPANGFSEVDCVTSPSGASGPIKQPYYALVEAAAAHGEAGARTLLAVYSFNIDTSHSTAGQEGGLIQVYAYTGNPQLCLRAESATEGSLIKYSTNCDRSNEANSKLVGWTYEEDYKIRLASTIKADDPATTGIDESKGALCIAAPATIPEVTTVEPKTYYRWDYSFKSVSYTTDPGTRRERTTTWDSAAGSTDEVELVDGGTVPSIPNLIHHRYSTGGYGGSQYHDYYLIGTPTAGATTGPVSVTRHTGEISRTETYTAYNAQYWANMNGAPTVASNSGYPRLVKIDVMATTTTGGGYVEEGSYGSNKTAAAVLVNCNSPYKALNPDGSVLYSATLKDLQWGWQANNSWKSGNGWCLYSGRTSGNPQAGDLLRGVQNCAVSAQQPYAAFNPLTGVGAGAASGLVGYTAGGKKYSYLINFQEFGRCADVNGGGYTTKWMIVYPCKQDPSNQVPSDNQGWSMTEPVDPAYISSTRIYVRNSSNGVVYCLAEPGASNPAKSLGSPRVMLVEDTNGRCNQNAAQWTRYTWTGRYASSYIIVSKTGLCLTADPTTSDTTADFVWSTITVRGCNGQANQKWNAPPDLPLGGLGDYQEIPAGPVTP